MACSTGTPVAPGEPTPEGLNVCALISDADLAQTMGRPIVSKARGVAGSAVSGWFNNGCVWQFQGDEGAPDGGTIQVGIVFPGGRQEWEDARAGRYSAVAGFGDDAVSRPGDEDLGFEALKGDARVGVVNYVVDRGDFAHTGAVMRLVLSKLER